MCWRRGSRRCPFEEETSGWSLLPVLHLYRRLPVRSAVLSRVSLHEPNGSSPLSIQPSLVTLVHLCPSPTPYAPCESRPVRPRPRLFRRQQLCLSCRRIIAIINRHRRRTLRLMSARCHPRRLPKPRFRQRCRLDRHFGIRSHRYFLPIRTLVDSRSCLYHRRRHGDGLYRCRSLRLRFPDESGSRSGLEHPTNEEQVSRRMSMSLCQCDPVLRTLTVRQP